MTNSRDMPHHVFCVRGLLAFENELVCPRLLRLPLFTNRMLSEPPLDSRTEATALAPGCEVNDGYAPNQPHR